MLRPRKSSLFLPMLLCAAAAAVAQPSTYTQDTQTVEIAGYEESVDIYRPGAGASAGVAIVAHGFTRSRIRHRDLGRALAEAGVTAVIPDLPNVMDLWGNGDAIVDLVQKLEAGAFGALPADRARLVLIGTSAGGLATVLAAAKMPGLAGWIGLDPVDRTGSGSDAAARLNAPAVVLLGGASSCNLFGSGREFARALPHLVRKTAWKEASHCDFEDPTTNLCRVLCGRSSAQMQARIRDETVRATLELLGIAAAGANAVPPHLAAEAVDAYVPPDPGAATLTVSPPDPPDTPKPYQ
jgi:acetyl esterase/lipase